MAYLPFLKMGEYLRNGNSCNLLMVMILDLCIGSPKVDSSKLSVLSLMIAFYFDNHFYVQYKFSSIHVYLFLQHGALVWSTWMTSCMQFQKSYNTSPKCPTVIK